MDNGRKMPPAGGGPGMGGPRMGGPGGGPGGAMHERAKLKSGKATVKRVFSYVASDKMPLVSAFVCVIVNTIFTLYASYMIRPIVNGILENSGTSYLLESVILMLCVYVIASVAGYLQSRIMLEIAQKSLEKIRNDLFTKLESLPLKYFDTHNNGDLMSRFTNDIDTLNQLLSNTLVQLISGVITLIGTISLMFYTNWMLSIITVLMVPVFGFTGKMIAKKGQKYHGEKQRILGELNGFIEETINGQKVVKVFCHEEESIKKFKELNKEYRRVVFFANFHGGNMGPVMGALGNLNYAITAFVGGLFCVLRGFDIGGYTIFVNYSRTFSRPISDISNQINTIFAALAGAERVFEVMDVEPEIADVKNAIDDKKIVGNVEIKNIDFSYTKEKKILKNISVNASVGQKIAFVGSTGAGKTTITNLLNRFYDIDSGEITIDGTNIKDFKKSYLRKNVAMVLQDTHLFTGTIMENLRYGRLDATDEEIILVAKSTKSDHFIKRLEKGYDTVIKGDGENLSQGQRQLLNITRTAISKAPILILDEATSSVDTRTEKHIEVALDKLMETRTTFIIAHRLSTVRNSDVIMVLENGEIIEQGAHDELLQLKGKYFDLCTGASTLS